LRAKIQIQKDNEADEFIPGHSRYKKPRKRRVEVEHHEVWELDIRGTTSNFRGDRKALRKKLRKIGISINDCQVTGNQVKFS